MALNATIRKFELAIADLDRHYYADHALTVAHHPSETAERVMVRIMAFAMHADDRLTMGRGLSADDEPDLVRADLTGAIDLWILVGLPDERVVRRACGRARRVSLLAYGGSKCDVWWRKQGSDLERLSNLVVDTVSSTDSAALAALIDRTVKLSVTVQEGEYLFSSSEAAVRVAPVRLHGPEGAGHSQVR